LVQLSGGTAFETRENAQKQQTAPAVDRVRMGEKELRDRQKSGHDSREKDSGRASVEKRKAEGLQETVGRDVLGRKERCPLMGK
jgi:hypothetical protein